MKITRRQFLGMGLASLVTTACSSLPRSYSNFNTEQLSDEQKKLYQEYSTINPNNLTEEDKERLDYWRSNKNQNELILELKDLNEKELEEAKKGKKFISNFPWIRQDIYDFKNSPKEIIEKVNNLPEKDLIFLLRKAAFEKEY